MNDAARRLLAKLPPAEAVTSARGELALALRFVFFVDGQTGSFVLEPDVARALASLGAVFFVVVLNEGA